MAEYTVPLNVDAAGVIDPINASINKLIELENAAKKASSAIKQSFADASKTADNLDNSIKETSLGFDSVKVEGKKATDSVRTGFNTVNKEMTDQIGILQALKLKAQEYQKAIEKATNAKDIPVLNKQLAATNIEIGKFSNAGKAGFDDLGNVVGKTAGAVGGLGKAFGGLKFIANILPGIGIAGLFDLIGQAAVAAYEKIIAGARAFDVIGGKLKVFNEITAESNKEQAKLQGNLDALYNTAINPANGIKLRTDAVKELQKEFPRYFANISQEAILNGSSKAAYDELTKSIEQNSRAKAAKAKIDELAAQQFEVIQRKQKIVNATNQEENNLNGTGNFFATPSGGFAAGTAGGNIKVTEAERKEVVRLRRKAALEDQDNQYKALQNQIDFAKKFVGGDAAIAQAIINDSDKVAKKQKDNSQKRISDEIAAQKRLQELVQQTRDAEITGIEDSEAKQIELSKEALKKRLDALAITEAQIRKDNSDKTITAAELAINKKALDQVGILRAALIKEQAAEEAKITTAASDARISLFLNAEKQLNSLEQDSLSKSIEAIDLQTEEKLIAIKKQYKDQGDLMKRLEDATIAAANKAKNDAINKYDLNNLQTDESTAVAKVGTVVGSAKGVGIFNAQQLEQARQIAILDVQKEFADKRLELLKKQGELLAGQDKKQNDLAVANAAKAAADIQNNLIKARKLSLSQFLGITDSDFSDLINSFGEAGKQIESISQRLYKTFTDPSSNLGDKLHAIGQSIADAAQIFVDATQKEIDKKQEQIDAYDEQIQRLEDDRDKENDLAKQGYANNVGQLDAEIAAKKLLRDQEVKDKEDQQRKLDALQKAQIVADSLSQLSSLITASTKIFDAFASIPFIGVPLAIAAIGTMFGAFAVAKVTAFNSVNNVTKKGEGGYIDGKKHSQGGKKYYSETGDVTELEEGEFVVKARQMDKYGTIVEHLNNDTVRNIDINEVELRRMLGEMGIKLNSTDVENATAEFRTFQSNTTYIMSSGSVSAEHERRLKNIDENLQYLVDQDKITPKVLTDDDRKTVIKTGNTTRTIFK